MLLAEREGVPMPEDRLSAPVRIDAATFREFAVFDALRRQKRWLRPAAFAAFFTALALLAFSRRSAVEGASLLGGVLLAVGLGLPAVYFGSFFLSVRRRARQLGSGIAYTLTLTEAGVAVEKAGQSAAYAWNTLHGAYRLRRCVCLYADARHALLLPESAAEDAWRIAAAHLPPERMRDCR